MFDPSADYLFQDTMDNYEQSSVGEAELRAKHRRETVVGAVNLEYCTRLCTLGSGCDMVEFDSSSGICSFFPHTPLKHHRFSRYTRIAPKTDKAIYVMQCADAQENVLKSNNPLMGLTSEWTVADSCTGDHTM